MVSVKTMLAQLEALLDTRELTSWEQGFVTNVTHITARGGNTTVCLTDKQIETIERIWKKHFA